MSAAVGNSPVTEDQLEEGKHYTIRRRGQVVASGQFTGRYEDGSALGPSPIFKIGDGEVTYARGHYSYFKEVKGGRRKNRQTRRQRSSRRSTRRQ